MAKINDFTKLKLNKLKISSMKKVVGGDPNSLQRIAWHTDACNSNTERCTSMNTAFTDIVSCCSACAPTNMKC